MDKIRIFVVDDNVAARFILTNLLSDQDDFQVVGEAGTGQGGIIMLEEVDPHVVILEVSVSGGMQTTDIAREIRNINPEVKIILCADVLSMEKAISVSDRYFDDFISKPYNKVKICRAVRAVMRQ